MTNSPLAAWHQAIATHDFSLVEDLLDEDAVFQSPAVHKPQVGKALVAQYLRAAMAVLNNPSFRYIDEWTQERSAVLEFELMLDDLYINGIDLIRWNEAGRIVSFKVMVRPLKGLNHVVTLMGAQLHKAAT